MAKMIEYAKGRYLNSAKIVSAVIFSKQGQEVDDHGNYPEIWKVAIDLDVANPEKNVVYSNPCANEAAAVAILSYINKCIE